MAFNTPTFPRLIEAIGSIVGTSLGLPHFYVLIGWLRLLRGMAGYDGCRAIGRENVRLSNAEIY